MNAAIIPDAVRRGLMDALSDHLHPLSLHWLANVKDAVRLNQVGGWVGGLDGKWVSARATVELTGFVSVHARVFQLG